MKYELYLSLRKAYRSGLKQAQLTLGQRHYEALKTATGSMGSMPSDPGPKYGIRDATAGNFQQELKVESYMRMLENLELEANYGFEYERPAGSLINKLLPRLSKDQKDIRRSDFKRYTNYPRKTAIGTAISLVILGVASLVGFPSLVYVSLSGVFFKTGALSSAVSLPWQGAFGAVLTGFSLFLLYKTVKDRAKKVRWRLYSVSLKRHFLGTRSMHWGRKLQAMAVFAIVSVWNLWWAPWFVPGRVILAIMMLVINQKQFVKTNDETQAFVAAWRFGLTFITTIEICLSIVGVLVGIIFIVTP
jgi:hypothetical protein